MEVYIGPYPEDDSERKVSVKIDPWDTWSMDNTLALIIVPMLKQLKADTHGAPTVDLEDVPEALRGDTESLFFERWDWCLDVMIYAFEVSSSDADWEEMDKIVAETIDKGFYLFGKYYRSLWD